jgi:N-acylneuraminate cytidylyltransferase
LQHAVAIIPARGGSTRIPHKNIKPINGIPAIVYSIRAARNSGLFSDIIISTDDPKIARISKFHGASIPFVRPEELSDDVTPISDVMQHAAKYLSEYGGNPGIVCCIYPVSPLLEIADLTKGFDKLVNNPELNFTFGATACDRRILRAFTTNPIKMFRDEYYSTRSQDLPAVYRDAGMFYFGRIQAWIEKQVIFGNRSGVIEIPADRGIDVDNEDDWARMEQNVLRFWQHKTSKTGNVNLEVLDGTPVMTGTLRRRLMKHEGRGYE